MDRTLNITANCDTYDSTYNYHTCTITDSSCAPGVGTCNGNPSGKLEMMEVPGVALFVHSQVEGEQLHMGILKDDTACAADVSGDYVFAHTAHASKELVGIYRSDSDFTQITHADFIMKAASSTAKPDVDRDQDDDGGGFVRFRHKQFAGIVFTDYKNNLRKGIHSSCQFEMDSHFPSAAHW